jgi:hypothetical protein
LDDIRYSVSSPRKAETFSISEDQVGNALAAGLCLLSSKQGKDLLYAQTDAVWRWLVMSFSTRVDEHSWPRHPEWHAPK